MTALIHNGQEWVEGININSILSAPNLKLIFQKKGLEILKAASLGWGGTVKKSWVDELEGERTEWVTYKNMIFPGYM